MVAEYFRRWFEIPEHHAGIASLTNTEILFNFRFHTQDNCDVKDHLKIKHCSLEILNFIEVGMKSDI